LCGNCRQPSAKRYSSKIGCRTTRAGVAAQYECGIFARVLGWLDALGVAYELSPALGKCMKAQGQECVYTITVH
jgi:hypothetical protein